MQMPCDSVIESLITRLKKEDENSEHERRSAHRTPLVRPVTVRITGQDDECQGFSKNISPLGIGLILDREVLQGTSAKLTIHSMTNRPVHIQSELRWCQSFCGDWYLTGWKFIAAVSGR